MGSRCVGDWMQFHQLERREFVTLLGGAAVAWPLSAHAQQSQRMRRIGVLMHAAADETDAQARLAAFLQGLQGAGWQVWRNAAVSTGWSRGHATRLARAAAELIA